MNTNIRCLIVDDEALAREAIRSLIALDPTLEVVGEVEDGGRAIQVIDGLRPDLLFLDVQMPEVDGFEVLQELAARRTPSITCSSPSGRSVSRIRWRRPSLELLPTAARRLRTSWPTCWPAATSWLDGQRGCR